MRHPILNTVLHLIRKTLWHKGKKETVQGHVWMWELDYKECWAPKNWCSWTLVLEKTLQRVPWTARRSNNQSSRKSVLSIWGTDNEAETPILWPPDAKNWLTGKDPDTGKDWRQKEKGMTEDEVAGWHHWLDGHEPEQASEVGDGQGSLHAAIHGVKKSQTQLSDWTE